MQMISQTIGQQRDEARKIAALERIASALETIVEGYKEMAVELGTQKGGAL